jgi:DNA-binding CsgD family transcriptional regulator/tetratricopeptide (TPR) repeat protein
MVETTALLEAARAAYGQRDWVAARADFTAARARQPLGLEDLSALADCAWWLGDLDLAVPLQQEAYGLALTADERGRAALLALELGYTYTLRGEPAQGSGWFGRAARLLEDVPIQAEHGYLAYVEFESAFETGDLTTASEHAERVRQLGARFGEETLVALGTLARGRVLLRRGQVGAGIALLDEAMVAAVSDRLEPGWAGDIYCHLMLACFEIADLRRAGEWTEATARWCERMPGAGPFLGVCRVHRAQLLQLQGAWDDAERELARVHAGDGSFALEVVAEAHYQHGEVRRLRGDLDGAGDAYRAAHGLGRDPQPGLALLALAQGRTEAAAASIRAALAASDGDGAARGPLLPAAVEIGLAADDLATARGAVEELEHLERTYGTTGAAAVAAAARGRLLVAAGEHGAALPLLLDAVRGWRHLGARFEVARLRRLLAVAYDALGDPARAELERSAAAAGFAELGLAGSAPPAGSGGDGATGRRTAAARGPLTEREREVLGLVAEGHSNQRIAAELVLSVRTVERHLSTTYRKLGVHGRSARAAAVSHAVREGLLDPS